MSVSLRVTGTWAELTADGTVAIPATPQAGDRMYLFARWKDFSITALVANWTELVEFADGSTSAGNGTGSVKVGCWYRDWQPGDSDPTIDFSASPDNASVVIMVMQKGADDVWDTPVARTAAMTNWTTTSQSVSASATVDVRSSGVVMGLIGLRDDSAVMTRPTNGIDDSGGLVTWNGNYVESPATHHSTTTGFDGAADLGYRLVTTGATGVTLRMTGTISAAETGTALWVVQGVNTTVTPGVASLVSSVFAPLLKLLITPAAIALTTTTFAPQLRVAITPAPASLSVTGFAPSLNTRVTPPAATLTLALLAPQLKETLTPATALLSVGSFVPVVQEVLTPDAASLTLTTFEPLIIQNILIEVPTANLTIITTAPHVKPFKILYLDPGGDAVQAPGYFNTLMPSSSGAVTFDTSQKVVGVGSYKFDSEDDELSGLTVPDILGGTTGAARRISAYFRYDSVPDAVEIQSRFFIGWAAYSGGGLGNAENLASDDGLYATATPAKNAGQGDTLVRSSAWGISNGAIIDSVKIIYLRKYDVNTSIGISRVKWVLDGEEGPNHDNTGMPLTDTVVEVDVTGDRVWEWQHFQGTTLQVIAEARRGDTDTEHTQSWDYVKIEVEWHAPTVIMQGRKGSFLGFRVALRPHESGGAVLRLIDTNDEAYDGITRLAVDEWNRISIAYAEYTENELAINLYVNGVPELAVFTSDSLLGSNQPLHLDFGWVRIPGVDHLCWFDQIYIDNGDDLTDTVFGPEHRPPRCTAKLSGTVNENNWDTAGGTGAVDERPLSETNYMQHTASTAVRQSYTLQAASVGDVDISGESLIGSMGWVWGKASPIDFLDVVYMVFDGVDSPFATISDVPSLKYLCITDTGYPSNAAGIGMVSNPDFADTFFYEGGAVVAYLGPPHPDILLARQEVANETLDTIVDDLRADPPDSYEVCCVVQEFDGVATIDVYSIDTEGNSPQFQGTMSSNGGTGRMRITPGIEVQVIVTVTGATMVQVYRRLNVD